MTFSAGVDRFNFANMVACGFRPVTTCTDLLRPGGYGRLPPYLAALQHDMKRIAATTIDEYILQTKAGETSKRRNVKTASFSRDPTGSALPDQPSVGARSQRNENRKSRGHGNPRCNTTHLVISKVGGRL